MIFHLPALQHLDPNGDPDLDTDSCWVCTYCGKKYRTRKGCKAHEAFRHDRGKLYRFHGLCTSVRNIFYIKEYFNDDGKFLTLHLAIRATLVIIPHGGPYNMSGLYEKPSMHLIF